MATLAEQIQIARDIELSSYFAFIGITILCWDHILTLDAEIWLCWARSQSRRAHRVLVLRYLSLILLLATLFWKRLGGTENCQLRAKLNQAQLIIIATAVCVMLSIRAYQMYGRHRRVLVGVGVIGTALVTVIVWSVVYGNTFPAAVANDQRCDLPLSVQSAKYIVVPWICLFLFQIFIFGLVAYKTYRSAKQSMRIGIAAEPITATSILFGDGAFYSGIQALAVLSTVISFNLGGPFIRGFGVTIGICVSVAMTSRMFLDTYIAEAGKEGDTIGFELGGMDVTSPTSTQKQNDPRLFTSG